LSYQMKKLYETLGESHLEEILTRFYEKMSKDTLIGFFFDGKDLKEIAKKQKSFLMKAWGITNQYSGKTPTQAHQNLPPILKGHFDRRLVLLRETLKESNLEPAAIEAWVTFESKFRSSVQKRT